MRDNLTEGIKRVSKHFWFGSPVSPQFTNLDFVLRVERLTYFLRNTQEPAKHAQNIFSSTVYVK